MELWAHRGSHGHSGLVENTLPAFEQAIHEQACGIELDVHLSADGVPVVFHDDTLERLTRDALRAPVKGLSCHQLTTLSLVNDASIPTLADVLDLVAGRVPVNIEIKDGFAVSAVSAVLDKLDYTNALISSFSASAVGVAADLRPDLERAWISGDPCIHPSLQYANWYPADILKQSKATRWHTHGAFARSSIVSSLASLAIPTYVWTVNELDEMMNLETRGVVGVFTDHPGTMKVKLAARFECAN